MNPYFDVVVIGGGVVGLSAAIAMSARGASVAVIDARELCVDSSQPHSRVYAINQASQMQFEALNVWEKIEKSRISPYTHMHVWDATNSAHIDFDARMIGVDRLGSIIEESILKHALLQQASTQNLVMFPLCTITEVESTPDAIIVRDGANEWVAKLLIIADGAVSPTRDLLKIPITQWPYHQQAIVATVQTERSHQQTAYQVFHPDGPLAFLPLTDAHQCSIVWSTSKATALMGLEDAQFSEELTAQFAATLGTSTVIGKRHAYPLHMRHAKQYTGPRWLLMGDAAHTIHPLAGLGLNLGLADLTSWLTQLDNSEPGWSVKTLNRYQRERRHQVWQVIALMGGLKTLFSSPLPPIALLRGLGLRASNHLMPLKRFLIEQAVGNSNLTY